MTSYFPPKRAAAWRGYISLVDANDNRRLKANPTLAAGDVKVSKDGGAFANVTTLASVAPAAGYGVQVDLSATEMTADNVLVVFHDQTDPPEWLDFALPLQTAAQQFGELASATLTSVADAVAAQAAIAAALTQIDANNFTLIYGDVANMATGWGTVSSEVAGIDANVGTLLSRITAAVALGSDMATLLTRLSAARAGYLDNLSAGAVALASAVAALNNLSSAQAQSAAAAALAAYDTATGADVAGLNNLSAAEVNAEVDAALADVGLTTTITGRIDAAVSTRLAGADYTAPDNAGIASVQAKTDNLPASPAAAGDIPTAAENADKLLGRSLAGGGDGGRTVQDALRVLRNKRSIAAGTLTVTTEDDSTPAWTATVATAASDPVNSVDPD